MGGKGNAFHKLSGMDCAETNRSAEGGRMCKSALNMMWHRLQDDNCRIKVLRMPVTLKPLQFPGIDNPPPYSPPLPTSS